MDLAANFKTDKNAEITGVWHDLIDGKIKIARFNNPVYQKVLRRLVTPHSQVLNTGSEEAQELLTKLTTEAMAEAILVDWEGLQDEGVDLPYSKENAFAMMVKYPDFREIVSQKATTLKFYREEYLRESVKK